MKKILLGLIMLVTAATINAQVELQQVLEEFSGTYYKHDEEVFKNEHLNRIVGLDDLFLLRYQAHDIPNNGGYSYYYHFYDADCNLYKRLKECDYYYNLHYIARNVFTPDGEICRLVSKQGSATFDFQIIDEEGKVIQEITLDEKYGRYEDLELIKVGNKYKLLVYTHYDVKSTGYNYYYVHIYSCPGNGESLTSVENVSANTKRHAFPNPATDIVILPYEVKTATSMKIYDMQGKLVERKFLDKNKQELQLNVKDYPSGMYFFEVNGESNSFIVE